MYIYSGVCSLKPQVKTITFVLSVTILYFITNDHIGLTV